MPRRSCGTSGNSAGAGLSGGLIPQRSYLAAKFLCARNSLCLKLKLQTARHAFVVCRASKGIRFKTLVIQPFPYTGHKSR